MSAAPGDSTSPAGADRPDPDAAAAAADRAGTPAVAGAAPDRSAPLTSLTALLGETAGGTACSVDGSCG